MAWCRRWRWVVQALLPHPRIFFASTARPTARHPRAFWARRYATHVVVVVVTVVVVVVIVVVWRLSWLSVQRLRASRVERTAARLAR